MATLFRPPLITRGWTASPAVAVLAQASMGWFPLELIGQDKFFGVAGNPNEDWPNPRGYQHPISNRTHLDQLKINLLGKDQFFSSPGVGPDYDWPNPRGPLQPTSNRTHLDGSRLSVFGQDAVYGAPGQGVPQRDWPVPRGATFASDLRGFLDPLKIKLVAQDQFFTSAGRGPVYDYPNPRGYPFATSNRSHLDPLKLNLKGQDKFFGVAGQPPANLDWPVPRGRPPQAYTSWPTPDTLSTLMFAVPAPFALLDWPNPVRLPDRGEKAARAWNESWQNIALTGHPPPPNQYDWPVPRGYTYPADLRVFYPTPFVWQRGFHNITDTDILGLPVNVVMAGDMPIKASGSEYDIRPANFKTSPVASASPTRRLKGGKPSFTVKTDTKGYN